MGILPLVIIIRVPSSNDDTLKSTKAVVSNLVGVVYKIMKKGEMNTFIILSKNLGQIGHRSIHLAEFVNRFLYCLSLTIWEGRVANEANTIQNVKIDLVVHGYIGSFEANKNPPCKNRHDFCRFRFGKRFLE